jgi:exodeoxyribonuclease V beta subunit
MITEANAKKAEIKGIDLDGHYLVEASAGTGKTTTLCLLYVRLLFEKKLLPEHIITVTFTNAATMELKARIYAKLQKIKDWVQGAKVQMDDTDPDLPDKVSVKNHLAKVLQGFDRAAIYTIHGFCRKVLAEAALETGCHFSQNVVEDDQALLLPLLEDFWRKWLLPKGHRMAQQYQGMADHAVEMALVMLGLQSQKQAKALVKALEKQGLAVPSELDALLKQAGKSNYPAIEAPAQLLTPVKSLLSYPRDALKFATHPRGKLWESVDAFCRQESRKRQDQKGEIGFHDLLINIDDAMNSSHGQHLINAIGNRYHAMLVDEFQDTDLLQYRIFSNMQQKITRGFFVGDPKQAIYGFRGADIFAYLEAKKAIPPQNILSLERNFRSSGALMQSINALFTSRKDKPFVIPGIAYVPLEARRHGGIRLHGKNEDEPAMLFLWLDGKTNTSTTSSKDSMKAPKLLNKESAQQMAIYATVSHIALLLDKGTLPTNSQDGTRKPISAQDIAILVDNHDDARAMAKVLAENSIPAVLNKQTNVFATAEAFDFWLVLSALLKPEWTLVHAALGTSFFWTPDTPTKLGDEKWLEQKVERFITWQLVWQKQGFAAMFKTFMTDEAVDANLLANTDGKRRLANLLHLADLVQEESQAGRGMEGVLGWYVERLENAKIEESERFWLRAIEEQDKVRILTIHAAKGLEFPIVFCPFVWRRTPFSANRSETLRLLHPEDGAYIDVDGNDLERAYQEKQSELVRLFYVAITRAQYACHIVAGPVRSGSNKDDHIGHTAIGWLLADVSHDTEEPWVAFEKRLADLCERINQSGGSAGIQRINGQDTRKSDPISTRGLAQKANGSYVAKVLHRRVINKAFAMTSFSGLVRQSHFIEAPDYDEGQLLPQEQPRLPKPLFGDIAHFPKGAKAGECWHMIFEDIARKAAEQNGHDHYSIEDIKAMLARFNFDLQWAGAIHQLVQSVLDYALPVLHGHPPMVDDPFKTRFTLSSVFPAALPEFEFTFAGNIAKTSFKQLPELLAQNDMPQPFIESAKNLTFDDLSGFLKGFIDLVFYAPDGKYYLLDYKSNWLGDHADDYNRDNIFQTMAKHHYDLQYLIYTVALHRFLKSRGLNYEDFGGVYYLFLRGMPKGRGVYGHRPPKTLIQTLEQWFCP